jgi:hypothetical protein
VGLGLALLLLSSVSSPAGDAKPAPIYTNDDLDRVHPHRAETGVDSTPAAAAATAGVESTEPRRAHGEAYWRREAERLQDQLATLAGQADRLRARIDERRRRPGVRPYSDPQVEGWQAQVERLQARMRLLQDRLHDRARREGALPGWLR